MTATTCFAERPGGRVLYTWVTCSRDQREHAIPDAVLANAETARPRAFCGHVVTERRSSLFVPPGPRCPLCQFRIEQQRQNLPRPRHRPFRIPASLLVLVRRTAVNWAGSPRLAGARRMAAGT